MVGMKPSKLIVEAKITAITGCFIRRQITNVKSDKIKNTLSDLVTFLLPCLTPKPQISKHTIAAARVVNAPGPAL